MGPISDEAEKRRFAGISAAHAGKPKSEIQRERMRIAKLDKPKPSSQKQAMSATHLANSIAVKELRASRPELGYYEALAIVVANKKMNKETK